MPLANADFLLNWAANKIRPLCNLTWSARVVTYWWKFTEDILLWKIKLRFLYYTPVEAFRMVSLILLLLPLAFAADLPNIVIVLTDDQVTLKIVPWYKVGFWYWYCAMCLAKRARHFVFCDLNSTFLFCILHFECWILYFQFCILLFTFCIFHFVFCILYFSGCFLGRYDAAAKDEEADWRAGNHFWGVNVNLIRSTYRWKIFQI